jgi:hypothetical protein
MIQAVENAHGQSFGEPQDHEEFGSNTVSADGEALSRL